MSISLHPYSAKRGKQVQTDKWQFAITGAVTVSPRPIDDVSALTTFGALAQAAIDAHLGTSSEFTAAQFDATSMGADAMGIILDMGGQCEELYSVTARCYSGTAGATLVERSFEDIATLQDSTLASECAKGADGNIGIKLDWGNTPDFDALTAGLIEIEVVWRAK